MDDLLWLFGASAVLAALLANIGVWSPRRVWVKLLAMGLVIAFLPTAYASFVSLLSRPKPVALEWLEHHKDDTTLLAAQMAENEAIYLWVEVAGLDQPRAYALPWSEETARELHEAQQKAEEGGGTVKVKLPGKQHQPGERMFHPAPPDPLPPKEVEQGNAGAAGSLAAHSPAQ